MTVCPTKSELDLWVSGGLSMRDRRRIEGHLNECPICRETVASSAGGSNVPQAEIPTSVPRSPQGTGSGDVSAVIFADEASGDAAGKSSSHGADQQERSLNFPAIPGYSIIEEIHRGGQGIVYKALQLSTSRIVALKVLLHEQTATAFQKSLFEEEVRLAANLDHPNIVTIHDSGLVDDRYYYSMKYVEGRTLNSYLASANLHTFGRLKLFEAICSAVSHAHENGVVHRDLKPVNILVDEFGQPHVLDFGLAKIAGSASESELAPFLGTLSYSSPEQTQRDENLIDTRTDVYALGVILFEMLTGKLPYPLTGEKQKDFKIIRQTPPRRPSDFDPQLDRALDNIVLRTLNKDPNKRYRTAADFRRAVRHFSESGRLTPRRWSIIGIFAALATVVVQYFIGGALLEFWSGPNRAFEQLIGGGDAELQQVRVIAITDETVKQFEKLAEQANPPVDGVRIETWSTIRRLHGRLLERLAGIGAKAVVFDLAFGEDATTPPPSPENPEPVGQADAMFLAGVEALQKQNVATVVVAGEWYFPYRGFPGRSAAILARCRWGCATLDTDPHSKWKADLVIQRGHDEPILSLALAALGAVRQPVGPPPKAYLNEQNETVSLIHFSDGTSGTGGGILSRSRRPVEPTQLSAVRRDDGRLSEQAPDVGILKGDLVGLYVLPLPDDAALQAATLAYERVFAASDAQLRRWFANRVVIIGNTSEGKDVYPAPDGRYVYGVYGHAVAIDRLLRNAEAIQYIRDSNYTAFIASGALLGAIAAHRLLGRLRRRLLLAFALVLLVTFSVVAYREFHYLCNPVLPAMAMVVAWAGIVIFDRVHRPLGEVRLQRRPQS